MTFEMIAVDTNVLLYARFVGNPFHQAAREFSEGHGVKEFATTNVNDFQSLGFQRVWNPVAEA